MATPSDLTNIAEAGITSGETWRNKYPNYVTDFVTSFDYLTLHQELRANIIKQKQNDADRRDATKKLKDINKEIDKRIKNLKDYIADEYEKERVKTIYPAYCIEFNKSVYKLPADNDNRMRGLDMIVMELSKADNPLKSKKYGLDFWTAQRDAHRTAWALNKEIDGQRSLLSKALTVGKAECKRLQLRLRTHLKATFFDNYKNVWRDFGFQAEKYK